jgi:hypothetical protein
VYRIKRLKKRPRSRRVIEKYSEREMHNVPMCRAFNGTASVIWWSEFLATVPEILVSIPGAARFS